tara:strand:- start:4646 stop:5458 length:813 start_codon:yes stop_codon:yes gene_type:complete
MITFVCFLWPGKRNYKPAHVNQLANAVHYFYPRPHKFVCVTNQVAGFNELVTQVPMPSRAERLGTLAAPQGRDFPSSFRRMWLFSDEAIALGDTLFQMDVDSMVVGDLRPLVDYMPDQDFIGWRPAKCWGKETRIAGGTWRLRAGSHTRLWDEFESNPMGWIRHARVRRWNGSDQAQISLYFDEREKCKIWQKDCGIHGAQEGVFQWNYPPPGAKIVHCNGDEKHFGQSKLWMDAYNKAFANPSERTIDDFFEDEYDNPDSPRHPPATLA